MKTCILSIILSIFIVFGASAQYKIGDIDFNLSTGFGIYKVSSNESTTTDSNTVGASGLFAFTGNYAVTKELSVGLNLERNGFVIGKDSNSTNSDPYFTVINYRANGEYRLLNSEKNAIALHGLIGLSTLAAGDRTTSDKATSSGLAYEFRFSYKHFFGPHFAYFLNGGYAGYHFKKIKDLKGDVWKTSDGSKNVSLNLSGVNLRLGFTYRI